MKQALTPQHIAQRDENERPRFDPTWNAVIATTMPAVRRAVANTVVTETMLAGIVQRETRFRNIYQEGVPPGPGCGVGLCQITAGVDWTNLAQPTFPGYGSLFDPDTNLIVAVREFLVPALNAFPGDHQAAFDAYNLGIRGVQQEQAEGLSPDARTTGADYGRSVFESWITYAAIALGVSVDWSAWKAE